MNSNASPSAAGPASHSNGLSVAPAPRLSSPSGYGELKSYRPSEVICEPSDRTGRLYRIQRGRVRIVRTAKGARRKLVSLLSAGDIFGEANERSTDSLTDVAESEGDSEIWSASREELRAVLATDGQAGLALLNSFAAQVRTYRQRLNGLLGLDLRARLAQTLLSLGEAHGDPCLHGGRVELRRISQQDLADLVGGSRSFVSTLINEMKRDGTVANAGRVLCLLDLDALAHAAGGENSP